MIFWLVSLALLQPPTVPAGPIKAAVGEDVQVEITVPVGKKGAYAPGFDVKDCLLFRGYSDSESRMTFLVRPKRAQKFVVIFWTVGEGTHSRLEIDATGPEPPPPDKPPPKPDVPPPTVKPTAVTYVYEKDLHFIPGPVMSALNQINRERGILATVFEADTRSGTGQVPEQYKVAVAAATTAGLPALVVTADKLVLRVVKDPKTDQSVLEAVQ